MEIADNLARTTLGEIEKMLVSKKVVGEPMTYEGRTIIPLISVGFGFGAGGGSGTAETKQKGEGSGGGTGGGAGLKPVAIIVVDKDGVQLLPLKGLAASAIEAIAEAIPKMREKRAEKKEKKEE